jgi:hypothetical protein
MKNLKAVYSGNGWMIQFITDNGADIIQDTQGRIITFESSNDAQKYINNLKHKL